MEALLVFAKSPRPGDVKTRLTPTLSEAEAAELYAAMLADALHQYQSGSVDVRLYGSPPPQDWPEALVPEGVTLHWQQGDSLGPRMQQSL